MSLVGLDPVILNEPQGISLGLQPGSDGMQCLDDSPQKLKVGGFEHVMLLQNVNAKASVTIQGCLHAPEDLKNKAKAHRLLAVSLAIVHAKNAIVEVRRLDTPRTKHRHQALVLVYAGGCPWSSS